MLTDQGSRSRETERGSATPTAHRLTQGDRWGSTGEMGNTRKHKGKYWGTAVAVTNDQLNQR